MTLFSFIALALGITAATADRVPRANVALIAVTSASRAADRVEVRSTVRTPSRVARHARARWDHRPLRPIVPPLRGAAAARAPGAGC